MDTQFVQALYSNLGASGIRNTAALNYWLGQLQTAEAKLGDANKGKRGLVNPRPTALVNIAKPELTGYLGRPRSSGLRCRWLSSSELTN